MGLFYDYDYDKFNRIYNAYRNLSFHVAYKILNDKHYAEDAVQMTFTRVYYNLEKVEEENEGKTKGFIIIISRNISYDLWRKLHKAQETSIDNFIDISDNRNNTSDIIISKETVKEVYDAVKEMPEIYHDVFILKYKYDYDNKDISKLLGVSTATIRKRLQIIRDNLRKNKEKYE